MSDSIKIHINLENKLLSKEIKKHALGDDIALKLNIDNSRVEFIENENYLFMVFYIPEYSHSARTIDTVEINILFDIKEKAVEIFANNTQYFFEKYSTEISEISFKSFGAFIEKFLSIIFEDSSKIINHILKDTETIKKEYINNANNHHLIRLLTNSQINISTLKLIVSNQNKLIDMVNDYMNKTQQSSLNYRKNYILEELNYAKEFCETVMNSINTKFQVKSSEDLNRFTKYSFVTFVGTLIVSLIMLLKEDLNSGLWFFWAALAGTFLTVVWVFLFFRDRK